MPLRALFLDVGGTLLREEPARGAIYARAAARHGISIEPAAMRGEMRRAHGLLPRELEGAYRYSDPWFGAFVAEIFCERLGLPRAELAAVTEELFGVFEDASTFRLYPGVRELVATARERGLVVGVISNWSARLPRLLEALQLQAAFDFVLCSALERMEKPEPEIFRAALARARVEPGQALHAGDHPAHDVDGALACGLRAALVDHRGRWEAPPRGAHLVRGLGELATVILKDA